MHAGALEQGFEDGIFWRHWPVAEAQRVVVLVHGLQLLGNGTTAAFPNCSAIELTNGYHFRRDSCKEGLIADVDFVAGNALLAHSNP